LERTEEKNQFIKWVKAALQLELSHKKTKITNLPKGQQIDYLGYRLLMSEIQRILKIGKTQIIQKDLAF
jgi:hypothetical protein